jgi:hypothetical protein
MFISANKIELFGGLDERDPGLVVIAGSVHRILARIASRFMKWALRDRPSVSKHDRSLGRAGDAAFGSNPHNNGLRPPSSHSHGHQMDERSFGSVMPGFTPEKARPPTCWVERPTFAD